MSWAGPVFFLISLSYSRATFTCTSNPGAQVKVNAGCGTFGLYGGGGIGVEGGTPISACACNEEDLLESSPAIVGSAGPLSLSVSGCGKGPFSIGKRTLTGGLAKPSRAGIAYRDCMISLREGWWDWN